MIKRLSRNVWLAAFAGLVLLGSFEVSTAARQAAPPSTEIFLAQLRADGAPVAESKPINISNSPGYDNQPSFTRDGKSILFSSNRDGKQMDIYRYDITTAKLTQVTTTTESEYSPLVTPDDKTFSVIRVEADGAQRLWRFGMDGLNPQLVLERVKPVGYHAWIDATHLALFVLGGQGQPNTLQLADTATGEAAVIEPGIGRSILVRGSTGTVSFVSKPQGAHWVIKELNPKTRQVTVLADTVDNNVSEDCVWLQNGAQLLMASGTKIFRLDLAAKAWIEIGDFSSAGITKITRMAATPAGTSLPQRLALVVELAAK